MSLRNTPRDAAVFGIDIGKNVFHVVGLDQAGAPIQRATFRRDTLLQFFERAARTVVGMEACPGSQWLARRLRALGHMVRIVPAKFVKPCVKSNKSDIIDAEAIAEAVSRPTMRFVEIRSPEQVDMQALHRVRDRLVAQRTRVICQMRAFCLEYGIAMHQGVGKFKADVPRVLADAANDLSPAMRRLLAALFDDVKGLETRIGEVTAEIEAAAASDDTARRLMTVPGIGPLAATGLLAAAGRGLQFRKARDMAAWLGLVPRQQSTGGASQGPQPAQQDGVACGGGKTTLLGISKRGSSYLRRLLVHGARSCLLHLDRSRDRLGGWIDSLQRRMHANKVTVALAAKVARIAWAELARGHAQRSWVGWPAEGVITKPGATCERRGPATA